MAHFETWERETLNQFAREASEKLLSAHAEIGRLKKAVEDWHDIAVLRERDIDALRSALKVIDTWAHVDGALVPSHVRELCEKALRA